MLAAGDLDRQVKFQRANSASRDSLNDPAVNGWNTVATVFVQRTPVRDGERVTAAQVGREISDRFVTHWSPALAAVGGGDQLVCEGVVYRITERKEIDRRRGLEFTALARPDLIVE